MSQLYKIDENLEKRIYDATEGTEPSKVFIEKSIIERLNRIEARDDRARIQRLKNDMELLKPIIKAIMEEMKNE